MEPKEILRLTKGYQMQIDSLQAEAEKLKSNLSHIGTCLLILENTKSEEGLKDLPSLIKNLAEYVEQALRENNG